MKIKVNDLIETTYYPSSEVLDCLNLFKEQNGSLNTLLPKTMHV